MLLPCADEPRQPASCSPRCSSCRVSRCRPPYGRRRPLDARRSRLPPCSSSSCARREMPRHDDHRPGTCVGTAPLARGRCADDRVGVWRSGHRQPRDVHRLAPPGERLAEHGLHARAHRAAAGRPASAAAARAGRRSGRRRHRRRAQPIPGHRRSTSSSCRAASCAGPSSSRHVNFDVLRRPNVDRRESDDARNYLLRARGGYDVITADAIMPTEPWREQPVFRWSTFVSCATRWRPAASRCTGTARRDPPENRLILRAFVAAFPHTTLWGDGKLMVGWKDAPALSREPDRDAAGRSPRLRRVLDADERRAVRSPCADVPRQSRSRLARWRGPGAPLT